MKDFLEVPMKPTRVTAACAFAAMGGTAGMVMSFGLAKVLVRTKRITPADPPTM